MKTKTTLTAQSRLLFLLVLFFSSSSSTLAQEIIGERSPFYDGLYDYSTVPTLSGYFKWVVYGGNIEGQREGSGLRNIKIRWATENSDIGKHGEGYINLIVYEDQTKTKVVESDYLHVKFKLHCKSNANCEDYKFTCEELRSILSGYELQNNDVNSWEAAFKFYNEALQTYPELANCALGDFGSYLYGNVSFYNKNDTETYDYKHLDQNIIMPSAEARIIKHRKVDLDIRYEGDNIPEGLNLTIKQKKHHFSFGTAIKEDRLDFNTTDDLHFNDSHITGYIEEIEDLGFNKLVPEGRFRFQNVKRYSTGTENNANAVTGMNLFLKNLDKLFEKGFKVRGHSIIAENLTHFFSNNPPSSGFEVCVPPRRDADCLAKIKTEVLNMVDKRFETLNTTFTETDWSQYITEWDILNHPIKDLESTKDLNSCINCINHNFDNPVSEFYEPLFDRVALKCNNCELYLNEDFVLYGNTNHLKNYIEKIKQLEHLGLTGIGLQSHYVFNDMYKDGNLKKDHSAGYALNRLYELKRSFPELSLQITEFDYGIKKKNNQDDVVYDNEIDFSQLEDRYPNIDQDELNSIQMNDSKTLLTTFFSHPDVNGIVVWGIADFMPDNQSPPKMRQLHWRPNASFYKATPEGLVPRAGIDWFRQLMTEKWMTNESFEINGNTRNEYERIFKGSYEFVITNNNGEVIFQSNLESIDKHSELIITFGENIQISITEK